MGEWLSPEEAAAILGGGFQGSNEMDGGEAMIEDNDGDVTTLVREAGRVVVFVLYKSGKKERVGVAEGLHVNVDTKAVKIRFLRDGATERNWCMPLPKDMSKEAGGELLKAIFSVSRCTQLDLKVSTENGLRSTQEPVREMASQYAMLMGSSALPCEKDLEIMKEGEAILEDLEKTAVVMRDIKTQSFHLKDDVVPTLLVASKQLEVIFSSIDILELWVNEMSGHLSQLENTLNTHTTQTSLMSKAKNFFSIGKKQTKAVPDILTIGGLPPAQYEENMHNTVSKFLAMNEAPRRPEPSASLPGDSLPQLPGAAEGEESE